MKSVFTCCSQHPLSPWFRFLPSSVLRKIRLQMQSSFSSSALAFLFSSRLLPLVYYLWFARRFPSNWLNKREQKRPQIFFTGTTFQQRETSGWLWWDGPSRVTFHEVPTLFSPGATLAIGSGLSFRLLDSIKSIIGVIYINPVITLYSLEIKQFLCKINCCKKIFAITQYYLVFHSGNNNWLSFLFCLSFIFFYFWDFSAVTSILSFFPPFHTLCWTFPSYLSNFYSLN